MKRYVHFDPSQLEKDSVDQTAEINQPTKRSSNQQTNEQIPTNKQVTFNLRKHGQILRTSIRKHAIPSKMYPLVLELGRGGG